MYSSLDLTERVSLLPRRRATSLERDRSVSSTDWRAARPRTELFEDQADVFRRTRGRPNQQRSKMRVVQRYGGRCILCDSTVSEWLVAAHLVGDAEKGSNDPRNGLPLCSNHHTAFDRGLVSIDPSDLRIYVRGYITADLDIRRRDLTHLPAQPAIEALSYRWIHRDPEGWAPAQ
jgi:putative restriction endonuclease